MKRKTILRLFLYSILALILFVFAVDYWVERCTDKLVSNDLEKVPSMETGLLLGTSKLLSSGQANQYFDYRIEAAVKLLEAGKIQKIIVSGDHSSDAYDETRDMKEALMSKGISEELILLDGEGFNTKLSIKNAKEKFKQQRVVIISQEFHNRRAVYLASKIGLEAFAYNADMVKAYGGFKTLLREKIARVAIIF